MTADVHGELRVIPSLLEMCVARVANDPSLLAQYHFLPDDICYMILSSLVRQQRLDDEALSYFSSRARLRRFALADSQITDYGLSKIVGQPVEWLDVSNCTRLRHLAVQIIMYASCIPGRKIIGSLWTLSGHLLPHPLHIASAPQLTL